MSSPRPSLLSRGNLYLYERKRLRRDSEALGTPTLPNRSRSFWSTVVLPGRCGTYFGMAYKVQSFTVGVACSSYHILEHPPCVYSEYN
jgi:hypothetical protein